MNKGTDDKESSATQPEGLDESPRPKTGEQRNANPADALASWVVHPSHTLLEPITSRKPKAPLSKRPIEPSDRLIKRKTNRNASEEGTRPRGNTDTHQLGPSIKLGMPASLP
eukprot:GHVU01044009.1.p6 GENE.GHVU01044009.1~~GHVU01044009.1.p6  ORF type:complete len:112 (+),score=10.39 GHVU01044009.1:1178-1513(+)